jgi:hypothetical protein
VVEPEVQLFPLLHILTETSDDTMVQGIPFEDGARSETVNEVAVAGARTVVDVETQFVAVVPNVSWTCHPEVAPATGLVNAPNVKSAGWLPKRVNEQLAV